MITEFPVPTAGSAPRDITTGPDGNLWFTEYLGNKIGVLHRVAPMVYVANAGSHSVSVINPTTQMVVATISVGHNPVEVVVTPDGSTVYVANAGSNSVSVIDTTSNNVTKTVAVGFNPVNIAIKRDGTRAYVANAGANSVSVIDTSTNAVVHTIPVGQNPVHVAVTPVWKHDRDAS